MKANLDVVLKRAAWTCWLFVLLAGPAGAIISVSQAAEAEAGNTNDWVYVDNGKLRLGVKKSSGAGIAWLSKSGSDRNLVNHFDHGRLIQQSYYGKTDGSKWDKQDWNWNPVQGGDWKGNPAKILEFSSGTNWIRSKTQAKHWASGADLPEVVFEQSITLAPAMVLIRYRMTYSGTESHPARDQEVPAIFLAPDLETLAVYDGDKPWTKAPLSRTKPGYPNETRTLSENWAAYVDKDNFGVGVFNLKAKVLTCYRFGDGKPENGSCSYMAPVTQFAITPKLNYVYDVFLLVGKVEEIRATAYTLHEMTSASGPPGLAPAKK